MKKKLWMLGMAVAALTSCTQSEVLDVAESRVIEFDSFVGKNSRAAGEMTTDSLTQFWVYCAMGKYNNDTFAEETVGGTHFFNAEKVKKAGLDYIYATKYWQGDKNYRFASFSNGNDSVAHTFIADEANSWGLSFDGYTVSDKDLVVTVPNEISVNEEVTNAPVVNLAFKHMLSKIEFVFYPTISAGQTMRIYEFSFEGAKTGNLKVTKNGVTPTIAWTDHSNISSYTFAGTTARTGERYTDIDGTQNSYTFSALVLPQSNQNLVIPEIKIQTLNSTGAPLHTYVYKNVSLKLTLTGHESWQWNSLYRYTADITSGAHPIRFNATVSDFTDVEGGDSAIGGGTSVSN